MWSRTIFWCVFAAFVLNILQPGYMQFYNVRKPLAGLVASLKRTKQPPKPESTPSPASVPIKQPVASCEAPKNDYERILFAQGIGGCNAPPN
jgi:hypothetical protein